MCTYLNCQLKSIRNKDYCSKHQRAYNRRGGNFDNYREHEYHNLSNSPEFKIWAGIRVRCNNPHDTSYKWYGERGIKVCKEWDSFLAFLKDMGKKPFYKAQLDRIDNNGDYCKENCVWTTNKENNRHTRRTKLNYNKVREIKSLYFNKNIPMLKLAEMFGVGYTTINFVIHNKTWT